ncbi:MAG: multidrug effflux MFS transporter [Proteobacteria bacterium]|nr:multidrug effflux MFS transporter [Pseudomonadota bacterium]
MTADVSRHWAGPRWTLALLLAGLSTLGPFSIDTYLPAFTGIARSLGATPLQMQQTLSAYLFGFAAMNLFHGALADAYGRRPVVLGGIAVFTLASVGCALADSIGMLVACRALQGMSAGAGMVVSRVIVRDLYAPVEAQRMLSQVTIWFGIAPALAPMVGGLLFDAVGWRAIFWLLVAVGGALWLVNWRWLPETLAPGAAQPFHPAPLLRGYAQMVGGGRFLALSVASGIPFNGMFLYVLSTPVFLGEHLQLAPTQFFWFFVCTVSGVMGGAWASGRLAGKVAPRVQVRWGYRVMMGISLLNVALTALLPPHPAWAIVPIAIYAFGWSMMTPVVTLLLLELVPERRGMASSVQSSLGSLANGVVAGVLAPLVMHSPLALAVASLLLGGAGLLAWTWVKRRLPG